MAHERGKFVKLYICGDKAESSEYVLNKCNEERDIGDGLAEEIKKF